MIWRFHKVENPSNKFVNIRIIHFLPRSCPRAIVTGVTPISPIQRLLEQNSGKQFPTISLPRQADSHRGRVAVRSISSAADSRRAGFSAIALPWHYRAFGYVHLRFDPQNIGKPVAFEPWSHQNERQHAGTLPPFDGFLTDVPTVREFLPSQHCVPFRMSAIVVKHVRERSCHMHTCGNVCSIRARSVPAVPQMRDWTPGLSTESRPKACRLSANAPPVAVQGLFSTFFRGRVLLLWEFLSPGVSAMPGASPNEPHAWLCPAPSSSPEEPP